ncbi:MAG: PQQ-binding-like beta-propeller repeat protein, partial [Acidobacteria bacterium]|nr:PQQ-binding-like beta-propeller repeat protein [Acidobacteriota bacterium]
MFSATRHRSNRRPAVALLVRAAAVLTLGAVTLVPAAAAAQYGATDGEWRSYGGDLGSTKYSPLDQIDASNFADLRLAWRWTSADEALDLEAMSEGRPRFGFRMFQATPLMVGGVLYISTALHQVAAIDAATGETIWVHDPQAYLAGLPTHFYNSRGVAYWSDGDDERIFFGTNEAYLIALDAKTGEPVAEFGDDGRVDLMEGIPRAVRGGTNHRGRNLMGVASPPIVARDVVVTPNIISDEAITQEAPPGWVKGVDARTGDVRWMFRTVPQGDDFGAETWGNESWRYSGNTNVWSMLTADE